MTAVFGIHLGNTTACLALFKDGRIDIIANDSGDRVTPAVVAFSETETIVGLAAKASLARNASSVVIHNKKLMNENIGDAELEQIVKANACKIIQETTPVKYEIARGDKMCTFTPEDVATSIFKKLFGIASAAVRSETDLNAVLCVPLHFSEVSRQAVMRAADEAGFEVLQVVSEPAAAVLAYGVGQADPAEDNTYCLVYRLGGVTLDVCVVHVASGMYSVVSTVHKHDMGGNKLTAILADYLAKEFSHKWKLDVNESRRSVAKLLAAAETCKHILSSVSTAHCNIESLCQGVDLSHNVTRARFENLLAPIIQDYVRPVTEALEKAALDKVYITKVILCGGSMKIPKLQQAMGDMFPKAEILTAIGPDETIATGAAKHGSYLTRPFDPDCEHLAMEVPALLNPLCFKVNTADKMEMLVHASTPIPCVRTKKTQISGEGSEVIVELYEIVDTPRLMGKTMLTDLTMPANISVEISLNSVGGVSLVVTDQATHKKAAWKCDGVAKENINGEEEQFELTEEPTPS